MPDVPASIARRVARTPAFDYAQLRAEGLEHIRRLAGAIWTDHNAHDPGITTLELLCYALTDLAYRTSFATRDLMTRPDGTMDPAKVSGLAPAHEVLTTAPRTIADYRRLLLRIEGVRNAWLEPLTNESERDDDRHSVVPLYADHLADALSFEPHNAAGEANPRVTISGLYRVLVELEVDDLLGSMNEAALVYRVRRGPLKGAVLRFDSADPAVAAGSRELGRDLAAVEAVTVTSVPAGFRARLTLTLSGAHAVTLDDCLVQAIDSRPRRDRDEVPITAQRLRTVFLAAGEDDMVPLFWRKQQRRSAALRTVTCVLNAHRGLCEDLDAVATVRPFRVGICVDVEVDPSADLEQVQAVVYHAIETYLSAHVHYATLQELLDEGRGPDEIFNGPFVDFGFTCDGERAFTEPGFITDEGLAAAELRRAVHASDIIDVVVDVPGVVAVRDLQLRAYGEDGVAVGTSARWTLDVPAGHQPVHFAEASKILFFRSGIPYRARAREFERTLGQLRARARRRVYTAADQTLAAPVGRWRRLDDVYSVQHDFPATYKVGRAGIAPTEAPARIAAARQFKGYLTFFDQVLADYLGQLANLRRLYSLDKDLERTWFSQYLTGIAGSLEARHEDEFYSDTAPSLADETTRTRLSETEEVFLERRNRVLDHLIARFAERFADYALLTHRLTGDRLAAAARLVDNKVDFLADYPRSSRERGQAANVRPEDPAKAWDSDNVSGLERRVARLLGIAEPSRRDLHCAGHVATLFATLKAGDEHRVVIRDRANRLLFSSHERFADRAAALAAAAEHYAALRDRNAFEVTSPQGGGSTLAIVAGGPPLTHRHPFDTQGAAWLAARAIVDRYDELLEAETCDVEGMHLLEHVLLRPATRDDTLMRPCFEDGDDDPYSFRATVVLPYWPARFRDLQFRALLERTLREEAPAHVHLKICWIGQQQMREFDAAFRAFLAARSGSTIEPTTSLRNAATALIGVLASLKTVYPAASLHACEDGDEDVPVRLGATALGIF